MIIAIADDEDTVRRSVQTVLEKEAFSVVAYKNGLEAWNAVQHYDESTEKEFPSLFILDIMMPEMDGLTLFKKIRAAHHDVPIMFLTSRDEEFDRVLGLELGADDYLCKPFSLRELVARVHVLLRRYSATTDDKINACVAYGPFVLNKETYTASLEKNTLELTVTEFRLLECFVIHPEMVFTREQLIEAAYPEDTYLNDRAVDCHIKRLRKKIGADKIETVYGLGYRFACKKS